MPIKLIQPLVKTFTLDRADEKYGNDGEPTTVTIRQASQREHRTRQDYFSTLERRYKTEKPNEISLIQTLSFEELSELEVYLTLCECNIADEQTGGLLFLSRETPEGPRLAMSRDAFKNAWGKLMPDVALEIHEKVLSVNVLWSGVAGEEL